MLKPLILLAIMALLASGCATPVSVEKIKSAKNVVIVVAFEPQLAGKKIGVVSFLSDSWSAENTGFDINGAVLGAVKTNLNRDVKLVDGKDVGVVVEAKTDALPAVQRGSLSENFGAPEDLNPKLAALGREWGADTIILIHSAPVPDWVQGTSLLVSGVGHLDSLRDGVFCVLVATVYECKSGTRTVSKPVHQMRRLAGVSWHKTWNEYPPAEQRAVLRSLDVLLKENVPVLLSQLGLTDSKVTEPPPEADVFGLRKRQRPQAFVPEGNELEIPQWASKQQAKDAVVNAFKSRGWTLTTDTEERMVGVYRKGKREAVCTVTLTDRKILLAPEGYEVQADEKRVPVDYYKSWHENLKVSIMEVLMQVPGQGDTH
jgi:hypothetical protein